MNMDDQSKSAGGKWVDFAPAGPDTVGGRYLRKFWHPVALSRDLEAGKATPIHVMGERFTLYRGETGVPHVVGFRCAHRSAQLSIGWVRDDCIQCMYHGWKFDGDGKCVERPGEKRTGRYASADIPAYPTREHLGLVYAYFGAGEAPKFPPFEGYTKPGMIENHALDFPSNWFQTMENHFDETHIAFVHSFGGSHDKLGRRVELPEVKVYETEFGMVRETRVPGSKTRTTLYLLPNIMRIHIPTFGDLRRIGGWRDSYIILVPIDDENHRVFFTQNVQIEDDETDAFHEMHEQFRARIAQFPPMSEIAHEILAGKLHLNDCLDHPFLLLLEDAITQAGQGQMVDRSLETLGRTDVGVVAMRKVFDREMRAVAAGEPTTEWRYLGEEPDLGY
jgi:5,5'-dehydrodivanillate O-demethylase oxygenase subunit